MSTTYSATVVEHNKQNCKAFKTSKLKNKQGQNQKAKPRSLLIQRLQIYTINILHLYSYNNQHCFLLDYSDHD